MEATTTVNYDPTNEQDDWFFGYCPHCAQIGTSFRRWAIESTSDFAQEIYEENGNYFKNSSCRKCDRAFKMPIPPRPPLIRLVRRLNERSL